MPTDGYFLPPYTESVLLPQRVRWSDGYFHPLEGQPVTPDSDHYRRLISNVTGTDVMVAGVTYPGGRWTGPLTAAQIAALTAAGYADRIVYATEPGRLPAGLP